MCYIKDMECRLFGLSKSDVCKMAYELAIRNNIRHPFNNVTKQAGNDWFQSFIRRHSDISLRVPEATSAARAQSFNKPVVSKFFEVLDHVIAANAIPPERIYNADETGIQTSHKPSRIVATKGRKQVGSLTSCERGVNTTAVIAVSAVGHYIPPMLIFARKRFKAELMDGTTAGTIGVCREKGWMDSELFLEFLKHFARQVNASVNNKVLLLVDGHGSHRTLMAVEFCRANGIILVCFPPHCTHRMQPLDVAFFAPLMTYYNQEVTVWLKAHPGRIVTQFQVGYLFSRAFQRAATVMTAVNAFQTTGIVPLNPYIFADHLFAPAETTDRSTDHVPATVPSSIAEPSCSSEEVCVVSNQSVLANASDNSQSSVAQSSTQDQLGLSSMATLPPDAVASDEVEATTPSKVGLDACTKAVSPYDIAPLPVDDKLGEVRTKRKQMSATILTSSPFLKDLKEAARAKADKETAKANREKAKADKEKAKKEKAKVAKDSKRESSVRRPLFTKNSKDKSGKEVVKTSRKIAKPKNKKSIDVDAKKQYDCIFCGERFVDPPTETWIQCEVCKLWGHEACADVSGSQGFTCDLCMDN